MPYIILAIVVILFALSVRVVPQAHEYVVEFLGKYRKTWGAGIHFLIPFFETIAKRITLMEQLLDAPPQPVITEEVIALCERFPIYTK